MALDQRQVDAMSATYSEMGDDELAYVYVAKLESLTDEAKAALTEVIRRRETRSFAEEVKATEVELEQQAEQAQREIERRETLDNFMRRFTFAISGILLIAGIIVGVFHDARGFGISALGVAFFVLYWVRMLFRKLVREIFRMNYPKVEAQSSNTPDTEPHSTR